MRKLAFYTMTICLLFTFSITEIKAVNSNPESAIVSAKPSETEEVQAMLDRLNEIKAMDMSAMTAAQKKELRKEVRTIKQEVKALSGGVYLSIGALIIIILLLILLL